MKLIVFSLLFMSIHNCCFGQLQGANWCFSDSSGINFDGTTGFFSSSFSASFDQYLNEPVATISDSNGDLLFYTNGNTVWNSLDNLMLNGSGLLTNNSITQGVLIVPYPKNVSLYHVFYFDLNVPDFGFYYSTVNMNLDNGNGTIENNFKNIKLFDGYFSEKLCGIKHANGSDWWILIHDLLNNKFLKVLVSSSGVTLDHEQYIGSIYSQYSFMGEMTPSVDGSKICTVTNTGLINLFNFDRCTGLLSDFIDLTDLNIISDCYSCEFSPNATKLYISSVSEVFQFDLQDSIPVGFPIWSNPYYNSENIDSSMEIGQMELAPDDRIYIAFGQYNSTIDLDEEDLVLGNLSVIHNPDSFGLDCNIIPFSFYLEGHKTAYGLPNMPNYNLGPLEGSPCDTLTTILPIETEKKFIINLYPNPVNDVLTINYNLKGNEGALVLYNVFGEKVATYYLINSNQLQFSTAHLADGIYLYSIQTDHIFSLPGKIIILR